MSAITNHVVATAATNELADVAKKYQKKTDKEHILSNAGMYIGPIEIVENDIWIYNENRIVAKTAHIIPGLYKLFDEVIVNARDHSIRMAELIAKGSSGAIPVKNIEVIIDADGTISVMNDGNGIDIVQHPEHHIWIPEMIFGHLRSSTNYNKDEKKIIGGVNGLGVKLVFIWSSYAKIETIDHIRGLKYTQEFKHNLNEICPPKIEKYTGKKPFTRITFIPDYHRLGIPTGLTTDMLELFHKRVYDVAATTDKSIAVKYNGTPIPVKNFQQYADMYIGSKDETKRIYEEGNDRWEYIVALSPTHEFQQISFVNGICCSKGGKHVEYILGQITRKLIDYIEKKKKIRVSANSIKEQLVLFLRCDIENPAFDSQSKDFLNTPISKFGSSVVVSDAFVEKIAKLGVMDMACSINDIKEQKNAKKTDGIKVKNIRGISKLIDANFAGTENSKDCILILAEGDSARAGIVSGLSSSDRNTIGIYALKGKPMNVRGETITKISENKEIADIKKILGLESGREYKTMEDVHSYLRYGKIMILTDADLDGHHIKSLCINLFSCEWSSLFKIDGFLCYMHTPILRAKLGAQTQVFYNEGEYEAWKAVTPNHANWTIKYYKGLGTSTSVEFKEYFANKKLVNFEYTPNISDETFDKVFNKKRPDDRKLWLENYNKNSYLDTNNTSVKYEDFIDNELIHFSIYDNERSIPNMVDGLKTSLRKILYCAFKRRLNQEVKVAQFAGYVSEHSHYAHGEQSLNMAIVGMAQNYVGSNNIPLLEPRGQFGSRLGNGSDSASERYIYTLLNPITRCLFPEKDDAVLSYMNEDGYDVEPEYYVPIIPFCLVNGISGIGTGFSCNIPSFNPKQIIQYLKRKLVGDPITQKEEFAPYYKGFLGSVTRVDDKKYLICGVYQKQTEDKIRIIELPIGTGIMDFKDYLETLMDGTTDKQGKRIPPSIKDFTNMSTETVIDFTIQFPKGGLAKLEEQRDANGITNGVHKLLKLSTTVSLTNMNMFDKDKRLKKYAEVTEIIDAYYEVRMNFYKKRKDYLLVEEQKKLTKISNKARFIMMNISGEIELRKKSNQQVIDLLVGFDFERLDDFKYLIKMPMDSITNENADALLKEKGNIERDLDTLQKTTLENMWLQELTELEAKLSELESATIAKSSSSGAGVDADGAKKKKGVKIIKKPTNSIVTI